MPPREPKGRLLTREYMADAEFQTQHDAATREFYLLLAMFADDAGWLIWDTTYLSHAIYRYDQDRDATFGRVVGGLVQSGRLKVLRCGHAQLPRVVNRPRAGVQETHVRDSHRIGCNRKRSIEDDMGSISPPNQTKPYLTNTSTSPNGRNTITPRAPARGGAPRSLKEVTGWEPPKEWKK